MMSQKGIYILGLHPESINNFYFNNFYILYRDEILYQRVTKVDSYRSEAAALQGSVQEKDNLEGTKNNYEE